ncbi:MAG: hypothetical protein M1818_006713 [Claussenomyces sp. TS43310]|nr:MAG: hypothetical protein M1818_006713 [Claussenomyces sp. TS43310]
MPPQAAQRFDLTILDTPFRSLPDPKRVWLGEPGSHEESLGRLNLLTPEIVAVAAKEEIKTGRRVGLAWDMTKLEFSQFGRQRCRHRIIPLPGPGGSGYGACFDDEYRLNPQQSSQWDGFRHYSQPSNTLDPSSSQDRVFYGGTSKGEIMDANNHRIGLHSWAKQGIAARGLLLDYKSYADAHGIEYKNFSTHAITFPTIQAMLRWFKLTPRRGDVLLIRMGVMPEWDAWSVAEQEAYSKLATPQHAGVDTSLDLLQWLWDSGLAAVAGDAISFEVFPTPPAALSLHEYLLAGWGMPIGELFDLETLAETCKQLHRYSFFLTSMPFNMPGAVSSPPNAMAIF